MTNNKTNNKTIIRNIARKIRVITVAPFMALLILTTMYFWKTLNISIVEYLVSVAFLCVLPVLAYPLQKFIPGFAGKGRSAQRTLAMIFANIGYILGIVYALIFGIKGELLILFLTYLLSGLGIIIFNKVFKLKASGHACGVVGPAVAAAWFFNGSIPVIAVGAFFILAMGWASIVTKRHTVLQLIGGASISVCSFFLWIIIFSLIM